MQRNGYTINSRYYQSSAHPTTRKEREITNARNISTSKMIYKWTVSTMEVINSLSKKFKTDICVWKIGKIVSINMGKRQFKLDFHEQHFCEYCHERMVYLDSNRGCVSSWKLTQVLDSGYAPPGMVYSSSSWRRKVIGFCCSNSSLFMHLATIIGM